MVELIIISLLFIFAIALFITAIKMPDFGISVVGDIVDNNNNVVNYCCILNLIKNNITLKQDNKILLKNIATQTDIKLAEDFRPAEIQEIPVKKSFLLRSLLGGICAGVNGAILGAVSAQIPETKEKVLKKENKTIYITIDSKYKLKVNKLSNNLAYQFFQQYQLCKN